MSNGFQVVLVLSFSIQFLNAVGFDCVRPQQLVSAQFLEERQHKICSSVCRDTFRRSFFLMIATST